MVGGLDGRGVTGEVRGQVGGGRQVGAQGDPPCLLQHRLLLSGSVNEGELT